LIDNFPGSTFEKWAKFNLMLLPSKTKNLRNVNEIYSKEKLNSILKYLKNLGKNSIKGSNLDYQFGRISQELYEILSKV